MAIPLKKIIYPLYFLIKKNISPELYQKIRKTIPPLFAFFYRNNLNELAVIFETDKRAEHHGFTEMYQTHFHSLRKKKLNFLEIGIGGGDDPQKGGSSLRMWKRYFRNSKISGIDIADKRPHNERRIKTYMGDQSSERFLKTVEKEIGPLDIIIDDGSHENHHVLKSFEVLFPLLKDNGIYVVEDTQTAYWKEYQGSSSNLNSLSTSTGFIKSLCDYVNEDFIKRPSTYSLEYYNKHIRSVHFYKNICFIYKK